MKYLLGEKLNLDWKISDIIPDFQGKDKEQVSIHHLLTHTSGLPGWQQFYLNLKGKERIVQEICATELIFEPGSKTVYSDLGMILMQKVLETTSQKPLDLLFSEYISDPLKMERTFNVGDYKLVPYVRVRNLFDYDPKIVLKGLFDILIKKR